MKAILITNNPMVWEKYDTILEVERITGGLMAVLYHIRNRVHAGHRLLTHPLSGSVKPNETLYKSALIDTEAGPLSIDSLMMIEASMETAEKFINIKHPKAWSEGILEDFQMIDKTLIDSAIESMRYNKSE